MPATAEHKQRVLANLQRVVDAGERATKLSGATNVRQLVDLWFDDCDSAEGEVRKVLQDAYYRRLAQLTGALAI